MRASSSLCILTDRQLATVLAALRFWQRHLQHDVVGSDFVEIASDRGRLKSLACDEIDNFCDELNTRR